MGQKSTVKRLPAAIRQAVDQAIRDGATFDEVVETIGGMGATASRSAVGRYKKNFEDVAREMREAQEMSRVWMEEVGKRPEGELGRLVIEILRTVAYKSARDAVDSDQPIDIKWLANAARASRDLETAGKTTAELTLKLRKANFGEAAAAAEVAGKEAGLSADTIEAIKQRILGVRDGGAGPA